MSMLVDTNVLLDVVLNDAAWVDWSIQQMRAQSVVHQLVINPVIYAELSSAFSTLEALDETLDGLNIAMQELPRPALFLAVKAFVRYCKQGGTKNNVLADFFIGAHAAVTKCPILTRDVRRYTSYFPSVILIAP